MGTQLLAQLSAQLAAQLDDQLGMVLVLVLALEAHGLDLQQLEHSVGVNNHNYPRQSILETWQTEPHHLLV